MSELLYYLCERPRYIHGHTPIRVEANWFWQGNKRFLIKGVSYIPRSADHERLQKRTPIDPLSDEWLPQLCLDIPYFHQLGINTISISTYEPTNPHDRALKLLADEGIHILFTIFNELQQVLKWQAGSPSPDYNSMNPASMYTSELIQPSLQIIEQTVHHPNVLAYCVSAYAINSHGVEKFSPLVRAAVRDCKHYIRLLKARNIPVGVGTPDLLGMQKNSQLFYTAGSPEERADFFAFNCFSWAGKSDFRMSGYEHLVKRLQDVPVPMFFSAYGTAISGRWFEEVECLYSPDMTGVFSGGVVYTYSHHDGDYDLVRVAADGSRRRTKDFWKYKEQLQLVAAREARAEHTNEQGPKDYENWRGETPDLSMDWKVDTARMSSFPLDWAVLCNAASRDQDDWELL